MRARSHARRTTDVAQLNASQTKGISMRHLIFGAVAIAAAALVLPASTPAQAETTYPWCGYDRYGWGGCSFATLEQCRAFISGANGRCQSNPHYASGAYTAPPVRTRR
jgi:hypothetical protein